LRVRYDTEKALMSVVVGFSNHCRRTTLVVPASVVEQPLFAVVSVDTVVAFALCTSEVK
jgi:hypothetical protein